jgi:hypothetical protein
MKISRKYRFDFPYRYAALCKRLTGIIGAKCDIREILSGRRYSQSKNFPRKTFILSGFYFHFRGNPRPIPIPAEHFMPHYVYGNLFNRDSPVLSIIELFALAPFCHPFLHWNAANLIAQLK